MPAVKLAEKSEETGYLNFKSDITERGLKQHTRIKHRISQVDETKNFDSEDCKENGQVTKKLDENSIDYMSQTYFIFVKENMGK